MGAKGGAFVIGAWPVGFEELGWPYEGYFDMAKPEYRDLWVKLTSGREFRLGYLEAEEMHGLLSEVFGNGVESEGDGH